MLVFLTILSCVGLFMGPLTSAINVVLILFRVLPVFNNPYKLYDPFHCPIITSVLALVNYIVIYVIGLLLDYGIIKTQWYIYNYTTQYVVYFIICNVCFVLNIIYYINKIKEKRSGGN